MSDKWGNPNLKSFKNNHIRRVMVDLARVFVNRKITVETEDLLMRASEYGAKFSPDGLPAILPAYDMDESEEAQLGLKFRIPDFDKNIDANEFGFVQDGDCFTFVGQPEPVVEEKSKPQRTLIGEREVGVGDKGLDVDWVIEFCGIPNPNEVHEFTDEVAGFVKVAQRKLGIPETGKMDFYTWQSVLPKKTDRVLDGEAGQRVRALQAALQVNGYNTPVDGRFGIRTVRALRDFQSDNDLRIQPKAGLLEWNLLFPNQ